MHDGVAQLFERQLADDVDLPTQAMHPRFAAARRHGEDLEIVLEGDRRLQSRLELVVGLHDDHVRSTRGAEGEQARVIAGVPDDHYVRVGVKTARENFSEQLGHRSQKYLDAIQ